MQDIQYLLMTENLLNEFFEFLNIHIFYFYKLNAMQKLILSEEGGFIQINIGQF